VDGPVDGLPPARSYESEMTYDQRDEFRYYIAEDLHGSLAQQYLQLVSARMTPDRYGVSPDATLLDIARTADEVLGHSWNPSTVEERMIEWLKQPNGFGRAAYEQEYARIHGELPPPHEGTIPPPEGRSAGGGILDRLDLLDKVKLFDSVRYAVGRYDPDASMAERYDQIADKVRALAHDPLYDRLTVLDALRAYDMGSSHQDDPFVTEREFVEWLTTPEGLEHYTAHVGLDQEIANPRPFPADSVKFVELSMSEAGAYHDRHSVGVHPHDLSALVDYTGNTYKPINAYLRREAPPGTPRPDHVDRIEGTMYEMDRDIVLYRGTDMSGVVGIDGPADLYRMLGQEVVDYAFLSTSIDAESSMTKRFHLEIEAPAGTRMVWAAPDSQVKSEREMLLAYGTRLRVLSVWARHDYGSVEYVLRVRVVGQGAELPHE
jgi:hypothetical protein